MSTAVATRTAAKDADGLNIRQEMFCRHFVRLGNGTQAAIEAGYTATNAAQTADKLLRNAKIQAKLAVIRSTLVTKVEFDHQQAVVEAVRLAFYDPADLIDPETNTVRKIHDIPRDARSAIAGMKFKAILAGKGRTRRVIGYDVELKLVDRNAALDRVYKALGMFEADNKQRSGALAALLERIAANQQRIAPPADVVDAEPAPRRLPLGPAGR